MSSTIRWRCCPLFPSSTLPTSYSRRSNRTSALSALANVWSIFGEAMCSWGPAEETSAFFPPASHAATARRESRAADAAIARMEASVSRRAENTGCRSGALPSGRSVRYIPRPPGHAERRFMHRFLAPLLALSVLGGCAGDEGKSKDLTVGVLLPMTGGQATYGEESWNGM